VSESEQAQAIANLRLAFDLHDAGVAVMRQNLRRRFPAEDAAAIEARLTTWLRDRPGAELGDGDQRTAVLRELR
jgi:hypothetical protein